LSDEEKATEILPITVQHIYVLVRLGKIQEAEKLSSEISIEG
jgi:signal recognition particle subunit SRP72